MVLHRWGKNLQLEDRARPCVGAGEVQVRVKACGVGATTLNILRGDLGKSQHHLPRIPGHEVTGEVVEVGEGVTRVAPHDRVLAYFYLNCGRCRFCLRGQEPLCRRLRGYVGLDIDGGYAQYVKLPASNVLGFAKTISFVEATAIGDAVATAYHVCHSRAQLKLGERVLIVGACGRVGVHLTQMAKLFGAEVIAVDTSEERLERVKALGAEETIDAAAGPFEPVVKTLTRRRGVQVAVDLVGTSATLASCANSLCAGGRLIVLTTFPNVTMSLSPVQCVLNELTVLGSKYASKRDVVEAGNLVRDGKIKPIVSQTVPLEQVEVLHERVRTHQVMGMGAIVL